MRVVTIRFLLAGQVSLLIGLFVSFLLSPEIARNNEGISSFGIYARTVLPYALGFLMCGYFTFAAVRTIEYRGNDTVALARALVLLTVLLLSILLTPYSVNSLLDWSHTLVAATLFLYELILAAWFMHLSANTISWLLFALQCFGSLLAVLSLLHILDAMLAGQLIAQLAFWIQLDRVVPYILSAG